MSGGWVADMSHPNALPREKARFADQVDFAEINLAARLVLPTLLRRWLPTGQLRSHEWVALNPTRSDKCLGSFRINVTTGKWADFASPGARGGDPVSLAAYLHHGGDQLDAARALKRMLSYEH